MAASSLFYIILLVSSVVSAQETDVAVQESDTASAGSEVVVEDPKSEVVPGLLPPEVNPTSLPPQEPPKPEVPVETGTSTPVEDHIEPQIAFRLSEGGTGLIKTELVTNSTNSPKILGSKCSTDQDCVPLKNTNCSDGMCLCSSGYTPSKHRLDICLKVPSGLGDICEEESQCESVVFDSECKDAKCVCPPNYVFSKNRCWEKHFLGGKCNTTDQCVDVKFATCLQGVCTCQDPMIPSSDNKCLPPAGSIYMASCEEDIQCSYSYGDEARCSNSSCVCTTSHHFNGTKCIADKKLGDACLADADCSVTEINNEDSRMCLRNACVCAIGYSALPGEDTCTKSSGEELAVSLTWVLCIVLAKYYLA